MAEKCTNTSSPVERWINPYPLAALNHLTIPFSFTYTHILPPPLDFIVPLAQHRVTPKKQQEKLTKVSS